MMRDLGTRTTIAPGTTSTVGKLDTVLSFFAQIIYHSA